MTGPVAHMNWGILRAAWGDPLVAGFTDAVGRVNAVAERTPGYVWRMQNEQMDAEAALMADLGPADRLAATLSVWESAGALMHFVQKTLHGAFLKRRAEWFEPLDGPSYVIWPIASGHRPDVAEALIARDKMARSGATAEAFDFAYLQARGIAP